MNQVAEVHKWLKRWLQRERWEVEYAGIFGSAAKGVVLPKDYDLLIVVQDSFDNGYWWLIREKRERLINDGSLIFGIPISPTVLSVREFNETNHVIECILRQPIINVLGNLMELRQ